MSDDEMTTKTWVYVGRACIKERLSFVFHDEDGDRCVFRKSPPSPVIGGLYEVKANADNTAAQIQTAVYAGEQWGDRQQVDRWRLTDRAEVSRLEAARAVKRAVKDNGNYGDLTLREIKTLLATSPTVQRWGMITAVLEYLR